MSHEKAKTKWFWLFYSPVLNMKRYLIFLLSFSALLIPFFALEITEFTINNRIWGWFFGYLLPRILVIGFGLAASILMARSEGSGMKLFSLLFFLAPISLFLILNPPYLEDFSKYGRSIGIDEYSNNQIVSDINNKHPNYTGLLILGKQNCPYCHAAILKLDRLVQRSPDINMMLYLHSSSIEAIQEFNHLTTTEAIKIELVPDAESSLELDEGRFPTFLFLKNGKIIHKWNNSELGYPALDWIENSLDG